MAESKALTREDMIRQARQRLESLKAAGVEWLPAAPLPEALLPDAPAATPHETPKAAPALLFDEPKKEIAMEGRKETAPAAATLEQRRSELRVLAESVSKCTRCPELASTRKQTVFGAGDAGVELCFIGEAPGADEDAQGQPFVGAAGQLLNRIIVACGLKREEVYICNTLKCRPPGNRTPLANETANCRGYLERQLELVSPKFICALGTSAAQSLLGTTLSLGKLRGRFHDYKGIPVMCTYHPAYLLPHRSPEKKKDVWEDMKKLMERMGRPVKK